MNILLGNFIHRTALLRAPQAHPTQSFSVEGQTALFVRHLCSVFFASFNDTIVQFNKIFASPNDQMPRQNTGKTSAMNVYNAEETSVMNGDSEMNGDKTSDGENYLPALVVWATESMRSFAAQFSVHTFSSQSTLTR